jgi:PTS system N-acetylglucosamine-specific IIC component
LRLVLADASRIDEPALKALGSRGVLKLAEGAVQVVVGPVADQLASDIRAGLRNAGAAAAPKAMAKPDELEAAVRALGGKGNISEIQLNPSRLCLTLRDPAALDEKALSRMVRAVAHPEPGRVHLVLGPAAGAWYAELKLS